MGDLVTVVVEIWFGEELRKQKLYFGIFGESRERQRNQLFWEHNIIMENEVNINNMKSIYYLFYANSGYFWWQWEKKKKKVFKFLMNCNL